MPSTFPVNTYGHTIVNTPGIVHYMRLNDSSGSGDDADSLSGSTSGVTTRQAGALVGDDDRSFYFNGSSSYVNYGNNILLTGKFSVEIWIKPSRLTGYQTFASKENYVGAWSGWTWWLNGATPVFSRLAGVNTRYTVSGSSLTVNQWAHLVVTCDGTTLRMYKNGVQISSASAGTVYTSAYVTLLGAATNGQVADRYDHFQGYLDEFAVYNTALSASTVQAHYNRGITAPVTNLYDSASTTGALGGTAARSSMLTRRTTSETAMLRSDASATFWNTKDIETSLTLGVQESAEVVAAFGGIRVSGEDQSLLAATETFGVSSVLDMSMDYSVLASEEQDLFGHTAILEETRLFEADYGVAEPLMNINDAYPDLVKRRLGFIYFAAQRMFNGNISIEHRHTPIVRLRKRYPGSLGTFTLGVSKLGDDAPVDYAVSDLYFLVRNEFGMPMALGVATTDWLKGTIIVDFVKNMEEQTAVLKTFGVFSSTAG